MASDCPTCGRSFDSEHGMKTHHSQAHGVNLNRFREDEHWVKKEMNDVPVEETNIDRMVKHAEDRIKLNQEKFDLDAGPSNLD